MCLCSFRSAPFSDSIVQIANGSFGAKAAIDETQVNDCKVLRIQPVNATHWLNLSAGVWKSNVFLGRSLSCLATVLSLACE
jgi:hypothetical protein